MTGVSIVVVHYHTPHLAAQAVASVREDAGRSGIAAEVIIVDNGSDAGGAESLRGVDAVIVPAARNLGYAGGVNLGVGRSAGDHVIAMNADVLVTPGCIAALRDELARGAAAVGPRFHWDRAGRLLLPPTERRDLASEAFARLSARGPRWARAARRRWRRHARRHWLAQDSMTSTTLSGALLAWRRDVWDAVGPFDEAFPLYFEEAEWLARVQRRGWPTRYVPAASAQHLYNSSARTVPDAPHWFSQSARRFEDLHYGRWAAGWLRRLAPSRSATAPPPGVAASAPEVDLAPQATWVEMSESSKGYPAAGERLPASPGRWSMPPDVWDHLAPGTYTVRTVSDAGDELSATGFRR